MNIPSRHQIIMLSALLTLILAVAAHANEPLGSSEQFKIDQVHRSLDNVAKDLERIESADRDDAAALARRGAQRNLDQARDRLDQFLSRNRELVSHPDVMAASTRLDQLADAIGRADAASSSPTAPASGERRAAPAAARKHSATGNSESPSQTAPAADAALSRRQKFELQQIDTSLNNAESSLDAYHDADREDAAALALRGAKRDQAESAERLEAFVAANPAVADSKEVATVRGRITEVASAIGSAEAKAGAARADAATTAATATEDAQAILDLQQAHSDMIASIHGRSVVYYDNPGAVDEALAAIEAAEASAEAIRPTLLEFGQKYGSQGAAIEEALDAAGAEASSTNSRVAYNAMALLGFLDKLRGTRAVSAETVADNVAVRLADIDDYSAKVQQERLEEAAEMIRTGQSIDPNNPRLNRLRSQVDQLAQAKRDEQMARIASATWPGHMSGFDGPGSTDQLSSSVQQYLADDRDWGQSEKRPQDVLAVSVTGPWQVAAKDMFGRPIQWRLPVTVAITDDELRPEGVAQAFELSMVAKEGAPNEAPKSPPWDGFWVGDNYYLRMGELP